MCGVSVCILPTAVPKIHTNGDLNGINGHYTRNDKSKRLAAELRASIESISHRGPDDSDIWISADAQVGLAHCRLSINDLSAAGRQPLSGNGDEMRAVVNGEIYDYDRLRGECEAVHGYRFQSSSDSELVLALYQIHGAPGCFEHLRGEFAFVLCDQRAGAQRVIAARDRYGNKPLVYTRDGGKLLVASEAKAFQALGWQPRWDVRAIADAGWMVDDRTLFRGVRKVLPGHYLDITEHGMQQVKYWDAEYEDKRKPETRTIEEMVVGVRERLVESIRLRLRADVPIGIYLSGGIDSSAVAGIVADLARKQNVKIGNKPATTITCFSVAFPEASGYNESDIADRTATWLGVNTIKKTITEDTLAADFCDAVLHCEHHHFDLNFVAKYALSTLPREYGVKVVLTGEGADEHFAGYPYFPAEFLREADTAMPDSILARDHRLRNKLFAGVEEEMKGIWRQAGAEAAPSEDARPAPPSSVAGAGAVAMSDSLLAWHPSCTLFADWVRDRCGSQWDCRRTILQSYPANVQARMRSRWHPLHTAMYMWNRNALPNVLLSCLGDRTEMAHSVEARTPFLDHHFTEYVNRLPPSVKLHHANVVAANGGKIDTANLGPIYTSSSSALQSLNEKWILRQAVRPYITDELYRRKKHPFLAPTRWAYDGPLHRMFRKLLTDEAIEDLGFVDLETVQCAMERAWGEHAHPRSFRLVIYVGAWVTLSKRMRVAKADASDWDVTVEKI